MVGERRDEPRSERLDAGVTVQDVLPDRRLGRAVVRQADAERRADGDPARIEAGALTETAPPLSRGEPSAERRAREQANRAAGNDPARIAEGAVTPTPTHDVDAAARALANARRLADENRRAGIDPVRIDAGALTPMPGQTPGVRTTDPNAAMGGGRE